MKRQQIISSLNTTLVVFSILCFLTISGPSLMAQTTDTAWVSEFIDTYNSNDPASLRQMLLKRFHKAYHNTAKYWQSVFNEFGPVDMYSVGKDSINGRAVIWARSKRTCNFVAFAYKLANSPDLQINRMGVIRGMIPSGIKRKTPDPALIKQKISTYLDQLVAADAFSGVVLLAKGDELLWHQAYNYADRSTETPADIDTKFLIASTTKMFTAVAVAQLVEQGKLGYQDPISQYLPDYPAHIGNKVTIHHLLTHSSGIELDEISAYNKAIAKTRNLEELYQIHLKYLPRLKQYKDFELPGEFNYTNEGFDLAGYIVEKVAGQSFYQYLAENIFAKAGMQNTGDFEAGRPIPGLARGYLAAKDGERKLNTRHLPARSRPAGSFYATGHDLFRFIRSLQDGTLLKTGSFSQMITPKITSYENPISSSKYGYGFGLNRLSGVDSWGHAGVSPGVNSECKVFAESDFTLIVLSNFDRGASMVANYIRDLLHFDLDD